jgi:hypothetical protein
MSGYDARFVRQQGLGGFSPAVIEQARAEWVGRRVWCEGAGYAWVTAIDASGSVRLDFENGAFTVLLFRALGSTVRHAD